MQTFSPQSATNVRKNKNAILVLKVYAFISMNENILQIRFMTILV